MRLLELHRRAAAAGSFASRGARRRRLPWAVRAVLAGALLCAASGTAYADTASHLLAAAVPAAGMLIAIGKDDREGMWQLGASVATATVVSTSLKLIVDDTRPDGRSQSFPSRHSAFAFGAAASIGRRYGRAYGLPAYALAGATAWRRLDVDAHRTRDVVAGAAIGIVSGYALTTQLGDLRVQPFEDGALLSLHARW